MGEVKWVWEHSLFAYNPKRPDSVKKDNTVAIITKADHDAALRRAKAEGAKEASKIARRRAETVAPVSKRWELNMINKTKCEEAASIAAEIDARAAQIEEGE